MSFYNKRIEELNKKLLKIEEDMEQSFKEVFQEECLGVFKKYPDIKSFGWGQSTYYNDNEDVFRIQCDPEEIKINSIALYKSDDKEETQEKYNYVSNFLEYFSCDEDGDRTINFFEVVFGNAVWITVTPEGVFLDDECDEEE